jgi:hypothetical protein
VRGCKSSRVRVGHVYSHTCPTASILNDLVASICRCARAQFLESKTIHSKVVSETEALTTNQGCPSDRDFRRRACRIGRAARLRHYHLKLLQRYNDTLHPTPSSHCLPTTLPYGSNTHATAPDHLPVGLSAGAVLTGQCGGYSDAPLDINRYTRRLEDFHAYSGHAWALRGRLVAVR